jgi:hypothetical protein
MPCWIWLVDHQRYTCFASSRFRWSVPCHLNLFPKPSDPSGERNPLVVENLGRKPIKPTTSIYSYWTHVRLRKGSLTRRCGQRDDWLDYQKCLESQHEGMHWGRRGLSEIGLSCRWVGSHQRTMRRSCISKVVNQAWRHCCPLPVVRGPSRDGVSA